MKIENLTKLDYHTSEGDLMSILEKDNRVWYHLYSKILKNAYYWLSEELKHFNDCCECDIDITSVKASNFSIIDHEEFYYRLYDYKEDYSLSDEVEKLLKKAEKKLQEVNDADENEELSVEYYWLKVDEFEDIVDKIGDTLLGEWCYFDPSDDDLYDEFINWLEFTNRDLYYDEKTYKVYENIGIRRFSECN